MILSVCLYVYPHDKTKTAGTKIAKFGTGIAHHDTSPNQKAKGQGHRIIKCTTSRRDSRAAPSLCGCDVAQRDSPARLSRRATTQPCRTVFLKAIEWSASVMHSIECHSLLFVIVLLSDLVVRLRWLPVSFWTHAKYFRDWLIDWLIDWSNYQRKIPSLRS